MAVNMGIIPLKNLQVFPDHADRSYLIEYLTAIGVVDETFKSKINSYFDRRYSPVDPILW